MAYRSKNSYSSAGNKVNRTVNNRSKELYVYGNTVRELQIEENPSIERKVNKQREINIRRRKDMEYSLMMNKSYVFFMAVASVLVFGCILSFICISSSIAEKNATIAKIKSETVSLKADNDDYERRIERSVDISELKRVAMEELGMVYPDKDHIVKYDYEESDYVRQYSQVPNE